MKAPAQEWLRSALWHDMNEQGMDGLPWGHWGIESPLGRKPLEGIKIPFSKKTSKIREKSRRRLVAETKQRYTNVWHFRYYRLRDGKVARWE